MIGTMLTISVNGTIKTTPLTAPPDLQTMQNAVGGYIEQVPLFLSIERDGAVHECNVFCNEEGKLHHLPLNEAATLLWDLAIRRSGRVSLFNAGGKPADVLVGDIIVLYGDNAFMKSL